jgi:hypothetical protein
MPVAVRSKVVLWILDCWDCGLNYRLVELMIVFVYIATMIRADP